MNFFGFTGAREACQARRWGLLLLAWSYLPMAAQSAEVLNTRVIQQQERFILHSETFIQVPVSEVRSLLTDYENLPRINRDLKRVEVLERLTGGGVRMGVAADFCVLTICLNFVWVQDVETLPDGDIVVTIVPNRGDFRQGKGRWRLLLDNGGTRLIFDVDLVPNFWIPPVLGPWLMKRKLADEAFETAQGLERMATLH